MYGYVAHVAMHTLQTDSVWANVATRVQGSSRVCTRFIADFIVCDTRVALNLSLTCTVNSGLQIYKPLF